MTDVTAISTARSRARVEVTREITAAARRQLAAEGADRLSLRSVAREVGLVPSALYRYFPSKDDLLTALVVESYIALARAAERAGRTIATPSSAELHVAPRTRETWTAVCRAVRTWARRHPHQWALLYGSPVPGYRAPGSTVEPGTRVFRLLLALVDEAQAVRGRRERPATARPRRAKASRAGGAVTSSLDVEAADLLVALGTPHLAPGLFVELVCAHSQLVGAVSAEVFGHLGGSFSDLGLLFDHQVGSMADRLGLEQA